MKSRWSWLLVLGAAGSCAGAKSAREPSAAPANASERAFEVVPVRYASAVELAATVNELLGASRRPILHRHHCSLPKRGFENEMHRSDLGPQCLPWSVVADSRTNSLVVSSSDQRDLPRLLELIVRLDAGDQRP